MAITLTRTLKPSKQDDRPQIEHCRACDVLLIEHNHGCKWDDLKQVAITPDILQDSDISATVADVENYLLADYERYRDSLLELKALPPGITHVDGDTDNNAIENLKLAERKPVDYELATSGLDAGQPYTWDKTLSWEENIRVWEERVPIEYPEGYYQGIVVFQDDEPIYKSTDRDSKHGFKKLIKFDKVKKPRKSKVRV
jgi:hypothetical protein